MFISDGDGWKPLGKVDAGSIELTSAGCPDFETPEYDLDLLRGEHSFTAQVEATKDAFDKLRPSFEEAGEFMFKFVIDVEKLMNAVGRLELRKSEIRRLRRAFERKRRIGGTGRHWRP